MCWLRYPRNTWSSRMYLARPKPEDSPTHQPCDCAIDLCLGTSPSCGRIYPLFITKQQAKEEYVQEALQQGYIEPPTSPAVAGLFFVEMKGGELRPSIKYRRLNQMTVKYPYPLPLVPVPLKQLRTAQEFSKLNLRSAYNLVCIRAGDKWKTTFSTTAGHYQFWVMHFALLAIQVFSNALLTMCSDLQKSPVSTAVRLSTRSHLCSPTPTCQNHNLSSHNTRVWISWHQINPGAN